MQNHYFKILLLITLVNTSFLYSQKDNQIVKSIDQNLTIKDTITTKKKSKILPIVIPITEPAVGYGLVGGILYFLPKKDSLQKDDMVLGAAAITTNGTWFAGGGYQGFWKNDNLRYTGFTGYGAITMDYYGLGSERPIQFEQDVFLLMQQLNFRIGTSDFFLGGKYLLSKISIPIEIHDEEQDLRDTYEDDLELVNSGVSFIAELDRLNHFLSPTDGFKIHMSYDQNLKFIGSDRNWGTFNAYGHFYYPINDWWIHAFRFESHLSTGTPPFYAYPYVSLRGIPALRYQGEYTAVVETEQYFNIAKRWGVVGFGGLGSAFKSLEDRDNNEVVWNAGAGVRFLASRSMGVKIGMDAARGPEDWALYFTIGSSW